jgi:hypothetical protein
MTMIEAALDRLVAAYLAAGGTTDEFDPVHEPELDDLRRRVAPLRLPDEIEPVWRRFQELGVPGIVDTNSMSTAELAIGALGQTFQSRALLVVGSGGRAMCFLELDDPDGTGGGAVWTLEEFAPEMHEAAPSLAALFDATAVAWEQGIVRLSEAHPFPWAAWDLDAWNRLKAELLPVGRVAGSRPAGWLPRWLTAEGMTAHDVGPHGPTATIRDLQARQTPWTEPETIRGRVRSMVAAISSGPVIDDGTGEMAVYVPPEADPFRLLTLGKDAELDVRSFPTGMEVEPPFDPDAFDALAVAVRDA